MILSNLTSILNKVYLSVVMLAVEEPEFVGKLVQMMEDSRGYIMTIGGSALGTATAVIGIYMGFQRDPQKKQGARGWFIGCLIGAVASLIGPDLIIWLMSY